MIVPILTLIILNLSGSQTIAGLFFFYSWFLGVSANIIFYDSALNFASSFWIIIINLLVIYILGFAHGFVLIIASAFVFIYYIEYGIWLNLEELQSTGRPALNMVYVEIVFALAMLGYILWHILENSRKSDDELNKTNEALREQNLLIQSSNEEKTVMLKEIHHRVKNNLQVVTSLLRLQMAEVADPATENKFKESINRVITMAMIHEKLYESPTLTNINIQDYLEELAHDLVNSYELDKHVEIRVNCDVNKLGIKTLVPLALLINELLSNSLKHGLKAINHPLIEVDLINLDRNNFVLRYTDNGTWKEPASSTSLGLELIQSFTEQMEGEVIFKTNPTTYEFKLNKLREDQI